MQSGAFLFFAELTFYFLFGINCYIILEESICEQFGYER